MPFNGERLKTVRELMGLTQKEAAQKLGVAHSTYNRYENKPQAFIPSSSVIEEMAKLFQCSTDYLLDLHEYRSLFQAQALHDQRGEVAESLERFPAQTQEDLIKFLLACDRLQAAGLEEALDSTAFSKMLSEITGLLNMAVHEAYCRKEAVALNSPEALEASWLRIYLGCIDKQAGVTTALADFGANLTKSLLNIK